MQIIAHYGVLLARVVVTLLAALLIIIAFLLREEEEIKLHDHLGRLSESTRHRVVGILTSYRAELAFFKKIMPEMWEDRKPSVPMFWATLCSLLFIFSFIGFVFGFGLVALPYTRHFMIHLLFNARLSDLKLLAMIIVSGVLSILAVYAPGQLFLPLKSKPNLQITLYFLLRFLTACIYIISLAAPIPHSALWARTKLCFLLSFPAGLSPIFQSLVLTYGLGNVILSLLFERPIHAIYRHNILQKRIFLLSVAILMLTWSIPQLQAVWRLLGNLK